MATAPRTSLTPSLTRTAVPIILALLVKAGVADWGIFDSGTLEFVAAGVATWLYYFAVRVLERVSSTKWGWLLGYASAPVYTEPPAKL